MRFQMNFALNDLHHPESAYARFYCSQGYFLVHA